MYAVKVVSLFHSRERDGLELSADTLDRLIAERDVIFKYYAY